MQNPHLRQDSQSRNQVNGHFDTRGPFTNMV